MLGRPQEQTGATPTPAAAPEDATAMKIGYFDCGSGAAGDMILGAMISAGLSPDELRAALGGLRLDGWTLEARPVVKQDFAAVRVEVYAADTHTHRHLHHITRLIEAADLPPAIRERAIRIFTRLAEAEAQVHGTSIEKVHFHEVGAIDAIIDIVGASIGVERLGLERIICSPIAVGGGTVRCAHGVMPVPTPATAELLQGVPLVGSPQSNAAEEPPGELTTPTGAAILTTLATGYGTMPPMTVASVGCGAGGRETPGLPNILRLFVGGETNSHAAAADADQQDEIVVLEANLDDATGEEVGHAFKALFAAGAVDVFTTPITMKKNRPGVLLTVATPPERVAECEETIFAETTTFGIRRHRCARRKLARSLETVSTRFGDIRVKVGRGARAEIGSPEYEDCAAAAARHGVPLRDVMFEARRAWQAGRTPPK